MEAGLHGPLRELQPIGDLGDGQLAPEPKGEERLLIGREASDRRPEVGPVAVRDRPLAGRGDRWP